MWDSCLPSSTLRGYWCMHPLHTYDLRRIAVPSRLFIHELKSYGLTRAEVETLVRWDLVYTVQRYIELCGCYTRTVLTTDLIHSRQE